MISAFDITKRFGDVQALSGVSLEVSKGEIFGIVGPDGAGKSTLMKILASTLEPDSGAVYLNGQPVRENLFASRERIAYMPQRFGLYEDLTVEENIHFFGKIYGVKRSEIKEREKRLYDFSRLGPFKNRFAGKLSGGMKQKLGLACSLIHTPDVIILDEPTNGVDPVSRREFWTILYELLSDGVSIVVSTAYLDEAERCGRVALIHEGKFIRLDSPAGIKSSIEDSFFVIETADPIMTADFLQKRHGALVIRTGNFIRAFIKDSAGSGSMKKEMKGKGIDIISIKEDVPSLEDCLFHLTGGGKKR